MNKLLVIIAFLLSVGAAAAQEDYGVTGFYEIVADPDEYAKVLDKFTRGEQRLTVRECKIAYYGFAFQDYYKGDIVEGEKEMQESILAGDFETAYIMGKQLLEKYPVNLTALYWTLAAAVETKTTWEERNTLRGMYNNVTVAIALSGDGLSEETAFKTVFTGDMYTYCLVELELEIQDRYLWDNRYDMLEVVPSSAFTQDTVWFDNHLPLNLSNRTF